jgi:excisionase family DNA binding protein
MDDPWFSLRAAGVYAGVHPETLRRMIARGRMRFARAGKLIRIRRSWVDAALIAAAEPVEVRRYWAGNISDSNLEGR